MRTERLIPLLVLVTVMAGGCNTAGIKDMSRSVKGMLGAGDRTEDLQGTMLEAAAADGRETAEAPSESEIQSGYRADINYWRYGNHTVARLPQLEDYCNAVLDRVMRSWPGRPVHAHVYISPDNSFGAYTLPHGAIFVSLGTLKSLESEDELAALLGHEVSHLILEHHGSDTLRQASGWLSDALTVYGRSSIDDEHDFVRARVATWAIEKAMFPAWARGQENEADALGTDLLVASGYNADAMVRLLKKIETHTAQRQAWMEQQPELEFTPDAQASAEANAEELKQQLLGLASEIGKNLEAQLAAEHDAAVARQARVRDYLRDKHLQRPRPPFNDSDYAAVFTQRPLADQIHQYGRIHEAQRILLESSDAGRAATVGAGSLGGSLGEDPYTRMFMYEVRSAEGHQRYAEINLQKAYATDAAPFTTYFVLLESAVDQGEYTAANHYLTEMNRLFDNPRDLLPMQIRVAAAQGQPVSAYRLRCMATADAELITQCNAAAEGQ